MKTTLAPDQEILIREAVVGLAAMETNGNGRLHRGAVEKVVKSLKSSIPHITRQMVNSRLVRLRRKKRRKTTMTNNTEIDNSSTILAKPRGRKKNSGDENSRLKKEAIVECRNAVARLVYDMKQSGERLPYGFIQGAIIQKKKEFGLGDDVVISKKTIENRLRPGRKLECKHRGTPSPLEDVEEAAVEIYNAVCLIGQPLTACEGLQLVNDLIDTEELRDFMISWKNTHGLAFQTMEQKGRVGKAFWRQLRRRNKHRMHTKRGRRFHVNRLRWSKRKHIEKMYTQIYKSYLDAGVARRLDKAENRNRDGVVVESDSERFGEPCDIEVLHPDHILFMDEVGCNTNQKEDKNIGGTTYCAPKGEDAYLISSGADHRFTMLPIIAATGEPVIYVIIFRSNSKKKVAPENQKEYQSEVPKRWKTGIDITKDPTLVNGVPIDCMENCGPGKYYPEGPVCTFRGKELPALAFRSQSGGVTPEILVSVLEYLDEKEVFPRSEGGPKPLLILDGHPSRINLDFLRYINDDDHEWFVNIGVPYLTHLWQVADSSELNGMFKSAWYRRKDHLMKFKIRMRMPETIDATDIVPCINDAILESFGKVESNKKAIADRGWNPPNQKLLSDGRVLSWIDMDKVGVEAPETIALAEDNADAEPGRPTHDNNDNNRGNQNNLPERPVFGPKTKVNDIIDKLNISKAFPSEIIQRLIRRAIDDHAMEIARADKIKGMSIQEIFREAKRFATGVLVGNGIFTLNHPSVLDYVEEKETEKEVAKSKSMRNERKRKREKRKIVREARAKTTNMANWTVAELKALFQYKKQTGDGKQPTTHKDLLRICLSIDSRPSPPCSDVEDTDTDDDDETSKHDEYKQDGDNFDDFLSPDCDGYDYSNFILCGEEEEGDNGSERNDGDDYDDFML